MKILSKYNTENSRYTISYNGYLFYGDTGGHNSHPCDSWEEAKDIINAYGDDEYLDLTVEDNMYGVTWYKGDWY